MNRIRHRENPKKDANGVNPPVICVAVRNRLTIDSVNAIARCFLALCLVAMAVTLPAYGQPFEHYKATHWELGYISLDGEFTETEADIELEYGPTWPAEGTSVSVAFSFSRPDQKEHNLKFEVDFTGIEHEDGATKYRFERSDIMNPRAVGYFLFIWHYQQPDDYGNGIESSVEMRFGRTGSGLKVMGFLAEAVGTEKLTTSAPAAEQTAGLPPSSGVGTYTYEDGPTCSGEWVDGALNGRARCDFHDGNVFDGMWQGGKRNGPGTATYNSGDVYEGHWKDDQFVGEGKVTKADGVVYSGIWQAVGPTGYGTVTHPNGDVYIGNVDNGQRHGRGTLDSVEGYELEVTWKNGKRNGASYTTFDNGTIMTGTWVDDLADGPFISTNVNGRVVEVVFEKGRRVSQRVVASGDDFEGIGISLGLNRESAEFFVSVLGTGTPAAAAGILEGDVIESVNGTALDGMTMAEVVALIRGPSGTAVLIGVNRNGARSQIQVQRGQIDPTGIDRQQP